MKILVVFADMIGGSYLNLINPQTSKTELDNFFEKIGGTLFSNCYTPAPDTPRSSACMWSGYYPRKNGCNNRLKYPGNFLSTRNDCWHLLKEAGYSFNVYMRETDTRIGIIPKGMEQFTNAGSIQDYLRYLKIENNSFTFFYFHDLHTFLDNNGYTPKKLKKGVSLLTSLLEKIFDAIDINELDYFLFFSDHGFRYEGIKARHLIEDDRVKTTLFMKKKGENSLKIDTHLRTNLDVCPTILEMAGILSFENYDGKSLFGEGHNYVLIEDHEDFSVRLSQSIEHWAVITENNKFWLECSGKWEKEKEVDDFAEEYFTNIIIEKMNDFEMNHKLWLAMHMYDENKMIDNVYSDGSIITKPFYRSKWIIGIRIIVGKVIRLFF